jgi:hypothetical protein
VFRGVPTISDIKLTPEVVTTNFLLALITLILLILAASMFNQTLEENEPRIHAIVGKISAPAAAVLSATTTLSAGELSHWKLVRSLLPPVLALALASLVYGLSEPGVGLNNHTLVLVLTYLGVFAAVTYGYEGVQMLLSRRYHATSVVRVFPVAVVVAVIAVALTRITGFEPGFTYGFVAANALVNPARLTDEQEGKTTLYAALSLLTASIVAWVLVDPLRTFASDHDSWWSALPEGIAAGLFVTGLEGLFFQLLPIQFMDGAKILRWNKLAWGLLAIVSGFLFWEVLLNDDKASLSAMEETKTIVALAVVIASLVGTIALWLFFKALGEYEPATAEATSD